MPNEPCPLCGNSASSARTLHPVVGKRFKCEVCSEFIIDEGSEQYLAGLPEVTYSERRKQLQQLALNAGSTHILVVREPLDSEQRGSAFTTSRTVMIARQELRQ